MDIQIPRNRWQLLISWIEYQEDAHLRVSHFMKEDSGRGWGGDMETLCGNPLTPVEKWAKMPVCDSCMVRAIRLNQIDPNKTVDSNPRFL